MKRILRYSLLLLTVILSIGTYFTNKLMYIRKKDNAVIVERESIAGRLNVTAYDQLEKEEHFIHSPLGYSLKVVVAAPYPSNRYVIISHGVTENKTNSIKYMNLFLSRGFNVVIYDHRRHGESGGKTTSYGYYEKYDLKAVVDWLKRQKGPDVLLGIHGESMGAATMLLYAGSLADDADFYIADCPFSDLSGQLTHHLRTTFKLPPKVILPISNVFLRLRDKYSIHDVSPLAVVSYISKPVLFIHSKDDTFIPPVMTEMLYEQKNEPKKLFIAKNGAHAQSYNENKEAYEAAIDSFFTDNGIPFQVEDSPAHKFER